MRPRRDTMFFHPPRAHSRWSALPLPNECHVQVASAPHVDWSKRWRPDEGTPACVPIACSNAGSATRSPTREPGWKATSPSVHRTHADGPKRPTQSSSWPMYSTGSGHSRLNSCFSHRHRIRRHSLTASGWPRLVHETDRLPGKPKWCNKYGPFLRSGKQVVASGFRRSMSADVCSTAAHHRAPCFFSRALTAEATPDSLRFAFFQPRRCQLSDLLQRGDNP